VLPLSSILNRRNSCCLCKDLGGRAVEMLAKLLILCHDRSIPDVSCKKCTQPASLDGLDDGHLAQSSIVI